MRLMIDTMIAVMLAGVVGGGMWLHRERVASAQRVQQVQAALAQLQEKADYYRTLAKVQEEYVAMGGHGDISPQWFQDDLPINVIVPLDCPWLDLAPEGDYATHPPDPVVTHDGQAGFWYNPSTGVFRARVTPQYTDAATAELYHQVNGAQPVSLAYDDDPDRQPVGYLPTAVATASDPSAPLPAPTSDRPSLLSRPPSR